MLRVKTSCIAPILLGAAAWMGGAWPGFAQDTISTPSQRVASAWEFVVAPYFVGANITGQSQIGRLPATDLDVGTGTILENLHFGGMIRLEALYRQKLGAMVDIAYMKLGAAKNTPLTSGGRVRFGARQMIAEGMLTYRLFQNEATWVEAIAGGRYWDVTLGINATGTIAGDFVQDWGDDWLDPVIGARVMHRFNDHWSANLRGDIGGFGLASDFSWNLQGGVGYQFNRTWAAHLQYKVLSVDYDNGETGAARFAYDTITHGPLIGVVARF